MISTVGRRKAFLLVRYRLPSIVGFALVLWSLSLHVSYQNRPVLGRWSYEFIVVFVSLTLAWMAYVWFAVRSANSQVTKPITNLVGLTLFELGTLLWGTAYLLSALDARSNAARLLDGNLVGSSAPLAAALEWLTMVAFLGVAMNMVIEHRHARWINLTLPLLSVATLLTLAEGGARLRAIVLPVTQGFPTYSGDLWTRRFVHLNQLGFRDTDHVAGRRDGARRLLVVGDSYAFGAGIRRTADRFGERLVIGLTSASGETWQSVNASRGDSHTLDEIEFLRRSLPYEPDVVILLYVFNDIDYLRPVTVRTVLTEAPGSYRQRLHPMRLAFKNSYLFQEVYVRVRSLDLRQNEPSQSTITTPYADETLLAQHLNDLDRFVSVARQSGAIVGIVPFDLGAGRGGATRERYNAFVYRAQKRGLPVWPLNGTFDAYPYDWLTVNKLDRHPNERAHALASDAVVQHVLAALEASISQRKP